MRSAQRLAAGLSCVAACQLAMADRSRLGEDNEVIDPGDCELELASERKKARDSMRERSSSIQLTCGIGWRTELATGFAATRSEAERAKALAIEAKTSLRKRAPGQLGWDLSYGVEALRGPGASWHGNGQFIALEAIQGFADTWLLEAKLGTTRDRASRRDSTLWTLGVERALTRSVEARLEWSGDDRQRPLWRAGLRYEVWPDHALLSFTYGSRAGPTRERQAGLALTFEF